MPALNDCTIALQQSDLGKVYFPDKDKADRAINEGITKGEVSVAFNEEGIIVGFIWVIPNGAFHSFPYIHIIAVKEEFRSLGIGKKLLRYIEEAYCKSSSKLFLVVADFNPRARKFYLSYGYNEIGCIPDLYKKGVTELLMMKEI